MEIIQLFCGTPEIWLILIAIYGLMAIGWRRVRRREQNSVGHTKTGF